MAGNNIFNDKDSMDINELAALNEDISPELIEQLQAKIMNESAGQSAQSVDDALLFEEPIENPQPEGEQIPTNVNPEPLAEKIEEVKPEKSVNFEPNYDDNFIKKYKAKLNKQMQTGSTPEEKTNVKEDNQNKDILENESIEKITSGKIKEKAITPQQKEYNDSLDYLDGNVKYSKYVIYIDPENVDFIDSLTVKERKNLINNVLKGQHDITITKNRLGYIQTIIKHVIISILTIAISIPIVYYTINVCLEASIDNHRRSLTNWQILYREHGKINKN